MSGGQQAKAPACWPAGSDGHTRAPGVGAGRLSRVADRAAGRAGPGLGWSSDSEPRRVHPLRPAPPQHPLVRAGPSNMSGQEEEVGGFIQLHCGESPPHPAPPAPRPAASAPTSSPRGGRGGRLVLVWASAASAGTKQAPHRAGTGRTAGACGDDPANHDREQNKGR